MWEGLSHFHKHSNPNSNPTLGAICIEIRRGRVEYLLCMDVSVPSIVAHATHIYVGGVTCQPFKNVLATGNGHQ